MWHSIVLPFNHALIISINGSSHLLSICTLAYLLKRFMCVLFVNELDQTIFIWFASYFVWYFELLLGKNYPKIKK